MPNPQIYNVLILDDYLKIINAYYNAIQSYFNEYSTILFKSSAFVNFLFAFSYKRNLSFVEC